MSELYYNTIYNLLAIDDIIIEKQSSRSYQTIGNMAMRYEMTYKNNLYSIEIVFNLDLDYNVYDTVFIFINNINTKAFHNFEYNIKKDINIRPVLNTEIHIPETFATNIINKINTFNHLISIDILHLKYIFDNSKRLDYEYDENEIVYYHPIKK